MPQISGQFDVFAPAKVNLHLAVLDRRPDGFHDIESVFLALDFGDTLHFRPILPLNSVEISMDWKNDIPMEKNIIFRALSLFREKTGFNQGLKISVEKRIPAGGGLGGGSSNAASTLLALNKMSGGLLDRQALFELGAALGSDVPFFLCETPAARVSGRGEYMEPLDEIPCFFLTLVNPGFPSDTTAAYRLLDGDRALHGKREPNTRPYWNDFLPVFKEPEKSIYTNIISGLNELGADFSGLSGSGSTCFGAFQDKEQSEKAAAALRGSWNFVESCCILSNLSM